MCSHRKACSALLRQKSMPGIEQVWQNPYHRIKRLDFAAKKIGENETHLKMLATERHHSTPATEKSLKIRGTPMTQARSVIHFCFQRQKLVLWTLRHLCSAGTWLAASQRLPPLPARVNSCLYRTNLHPLATMFAPSKGTNSKRIWPIFCHTT